MREEPVEIQMKDGIADGFLYRPEAAGNAPGVLYLPDIGGPRDANRGMAGRLAGEGYTVLMPNPFYRTGRPPLFTPPFTIGDEPFMKRVRELAAPLTPEAMDEDLSRYIDFLPAGPVGVVGFCFTGAMALRAAAVRPDRVAAVASFHGGRLYTDNPDSPHLLLPRIRARLYLGHAAEDRSMPTEAIEKLDRELAAWGGKYETEVYNARHGWTVPDHPTYNEPEAERAFAKLTALLADTLKSADA
ncbi:MAG TPA: dienelactone hydrolase family protein [Bryobacteraceae bacterium]|nr:dienelactone hydrolase family protein [Bryobacteraceae bacterium]